jgi:tRNA nucleotidyltransferase (CCA-adding enzyme)
VKLSLENLVPDGFKGTIKKAHQIGQEHGYPVYLVGGFVRDILLGRRTVDIDIAVEGDAIKVAQKLQSLKPGKLTIFNDFLTAKIEWPNFNLDLATARKEHYPHPGALPVVEPARIEEDLLRRDFTINAMAMSLNPPQEGLLIDPSNGYSDLKEGLIRILHDRSFVDDATRMWRAVRYEQRLNFKIEEHTLDLLLRNLEMLKTISGDRLRYELECILKEECPEKALRRAEELGLLGYLSPELSISDEVAERFRRARKYYGPTPPQEVYLALLLKDITPAEKERLINFLKFNQKTANLIGETEALKKISLEDALTPGQIYEKLKDYSDLALTACLLVSDCKNAEKIKLYLDKLRFIRPSLSGNDLKNLGLKEGPLIGECLEALRRALINGEISGPEQEEQFVKKWLNP